MKVDLLSFGKKEGWRRKWFEGKEEEVEQPGVKCGESRDVRESTETSTSPPGLSKFIVNQRVRRIFFPFYKDLLALLPSLASRSTIYFSNNSAKRPL